MDLKQAIVSRHAVRSYARQAVDEGTIRALLEAAVRAPSARNEQPWAFAIVQNRAQLERYSDRAKAELLASFGAPGESPPNMILLRDERFNIFYDAGTLIVICVTSHTHYAEADCWLAAQNLMLKACDLGLGTCPIGLAGALLNTPQIKAELGIPERGAAIAPIVVGHPSGPSALSSARSAPRILSWQH